MDYSNLQGHYLLLKGVKARLSSKYQIPELVSLPYEYVITNDNIIEENDYNFDYETKYIEEYEKQKKEEEEKRIQELKEKAPGLTDKLEPIRLNNQESSSNLNLNSNNNNNNTNTDKNPNKEENKANIVSEFEDVPPQDPWDESKTNKDELLQLQMGMNDMSYSQGSNYSSNNNSPKPNNSNLLTVNNSSSTSSLNAQTPNMSYTSSYQPPPVQNPINSSPNFPPMSYPPPMPPRPMYPYTSYGTPPPIPAPVPAPGMYLGPNVSEASSSSYLQTMPQPIYQNRPFASSTPPPLPSRPNNFSYNSNQYANSENDAIVNSIVDMGFNREIVLSGMRNYGNDRQKVFEYVELYSKLKDKGYKPKEVIDHVINLYDFNHDKCDKFMKAFMELSEMGFEPDKIQKALEFNDIDREAAIDHLTNST